MAISSKSVAVFMLLLSTIFFIQLSVPTHARKLVEVRAPIISMHRPCTRSALQMPATQIDSTTPGHSPSIGHGSPPN
uniref:Transmembrane protein n=1 Tax=Arundo donax TaxID=35708 RepID=A0A0A9D6K0_ARUDO